MSPADPDRRNPSADWLVPPDEQEGLRRYVATLRERIWLIVAITALTTLAAIAYVQVATKTYEAEAQLRIIATADPDLQALGLISASSDPSRDVQTASELITNTTVADRVKEELGYPGPATDLLGAVNAEPVATTSIVAVTAKESDPDEAADLANAFAKQAVKNQTVQMHKAIALRLPRLEQQQADTPSTQTQDLINTYLSLKDVSDPTIQIATPAEAPAAPTSPKPKLSIAAGLMAGLVLGVAAAFAFQVLDPRLRREEQLRHLFRIPIIGRVPREPKRSGDRPLGPRGISPAVAEAYRTLRGTVSANSRRSGGKVLLVTGSSPSEGKTTTAINLAASLSSAGKRVILIEADLRRPAISRALGVEPRRGVVGVLIESMTIEDALIDADSLGLPNLYLLLAENEGGWISELFSLPTALEMLERARLLADYVIVDSPPLTDVVDALPLARNVDDVLIVVRPGTTRLSKLIQLGELLAENGIRPMGFAVVGTKPPGRGESTYYFDHREFMPERPNPAGSGDASRRT